MKLLNTSDNSKVTVMGFLLIFLSVVRIVRIELQNIWSFCRSHLISSFMTFTFPSDWIGLVHLMSNFFGFYVIWAYEMLIICVKESSNWIINVLGSFLHKSFFKERKMQKSFIFSESWNLVSCKKYVLANRFFDFILFYWYWSFNHLVIKQSFVRFWSETCEEWMSIVSIDVCEKK